MTNNKESCNYNTKYKKWTRRNRYKWKPANEKFWNSLYVASSSLSDFAKLRKATDSLVVHRLSAWNSLHHTGRICMKFCI
jgi:hypothetical protein